MRHQHPLDIAERRVARFFRTLLQALLAIVLAGAAFVVVRWARPGTGLQGEWFYFGALVLLVVTWIGRQISALARRERRSQRLSAGPLLSIDTSEGAGSRSWQLRLGHPPSGAPSEEGARSFTFSRTFSGPARHLPVEVLPDEAALDRIHVELSSGADLDAACRMVQPAYAGWDRLTRRAYRHYVSTLLDRRRAPPADGLPGPGAPPT